MRLHWLWNRAARARSRAEREAREKAAELRAARDRERRMEEIERAAEHDRREHLRRVRHARIEASATRIAEQLYCTHRLTSTLVNAPSVGEKPEHLDWILEEAVEAATHIEDGLRRTP